MSQEKISSLVRAASAAGEAPRVARMHRNEVTIVADRTSSQTQEDRHHKPCLRPHCARTRSADSSLVGRGQAFAGVPPIRIVPNNPDVPAKSGSVFDRNSN